MNDYQRELCRDAHDALSKASRALKEAEYGLYQVEGCEFLHSVYLSIIDQSDALSNEYYVRSKLR